MIAHLFWLFHYKFSSDITYCLRHVILFSSVKAMKMSSKLQKAEFQGFLS